MMDEQKQPHQLQQQGQEKKVGWMALQAVEVPR
jgi:hypothetical protein